MKPLEVEMCGITEQNQSRPDKPNEDALFYNPKPGIVAIADGVTRSRDAQGKYPQNSTIAPSIFINETKRLVPEFLSQKFSPEEVIRKTFGQVNQKISQANKDLGISDTLNYDDVDLLCTTGCIALVYQDEEQKFVTYGFIGDVIGMYVPAHNPPKFLTRDQLERCHTFGKPYYQKLVLEGKLTEEEAKRKRLIWQRKEVRNNLSAIDLSGNSIGFGVLTGEESALSFIEVGTEEIGSSDRLIFASDSLDRCAQGEGTRKIEYFDSVLKSVRNLTLEDCANFLIRHIRECEKKMSRSSDDATVVVVDFL